MKKTIALLIALCLVFIFASCAERTADFFEYRLGALECDFEYRTAGTTFGGKIFSYYSENEHTVSLVYEFPDSMKGITVSSKGGVTEAVRGDISLPGGAFFAPAELFFRSGEVTSVKNPPNEKVTLVCVTSPDGDFEIYFDSDGKIPTKIGSGNAELIILGIKYV